MPAVAMAAFRHNRPTIIIYGGTIQAGKRTIDCPSMGFKKGDPINIGDAFESFGAYTVGKLTEAEREDVVKHACPGAGACGGMFTANSMSTVSWDLVVPLSAYLHARSLTSLCRL